MARGIIASRGIIAYGAYVPYWRLDRRQIAAAMGTGGGRGHRSVASYDEDTTTMAVEAARNALRGTDLVPDSVIFATAAPAYADKTNATAIGAALDLPPSAWAVDVGGAARSSEAAWSLASLRGGINLGIAADMRGGRPTSADETNGGDGAVAFVFGSDGPADSAASAASAAPVLCEWLGGASASAEFLDRYRRPGDGFSRVWEERFGEQAYLPLAHDAIERALKRADVSLEDVNHAAVVGLHTRAVRSVSVRSVSQLAGDKLADDLTGEIGNAGAAHPGIVLASILDEAEPNQTILLVHLADGCTADVLRTTDAIADHRPFAPVRSQIARGNDALDYNKFLTWRGFLDREPPRRPDPDRPAAPPTFRSQDWKYAFVGSRDRSSGAIHLPPMRVSMEGGALDDMERIRMADVGAAIATFTVDRLAYSLSPPVVAVVVDFDGGGRFQAEMTDVDPSQVSIGDRVEMTFRRLYTADGIHNYFWKARPAAA